jgi:hypothetical protein
MLIAGNFMFFWILMTFCLHRGDPVGIVLTLVGFLVMHTLCEELVDNPTSFL